MKKMSNTRAKNYLFQTYFMLYTILTIVMSFFSFCNTFLYTQSAIFVFFRETFISFKPILLFFFLFWKDLERYLSRVYFVIFFCYLANMQVMNPATFLLYVKKIIKELIKKTIYQKILKSCKTFMQYKTSSLSIFT